MDVLRTAVSALAFYDNNSRDLSHQGALRTAVRLTAQLPVLVAAWDRIRKGQEAIAAKPNLNIATNFLYMLRGDGWGVYDGDRFQKEVLSGLCK